MTTLVPREPYSQNELLELYPKSLKLQFVQIFLRHGERTPVNARFQNAGLPPYWPYCSAATRMSSVTMTKTNSSSWDNLQWRRRLETFGKNDSAVPSSGPDGEVDAICQSGELTDKGRESTLHLGQRLRRLYVDQLGYMPKIIADSDMIYLRATPMPRALESLQQAFLGMYPPSARTASFPPPIIVTRTPAEETLYPNEDCRRFLQLTKAYGQRTADRWNDTEEMRYLNSLISKWMPGISKRVAVDSHPRLTGILDTVNSTLAHGPKTRLPAKFYDRKGLEIMDKIGCEEWFSGYQESLEYRKVGIGPLVGDIVARMLGTVERKSSDGIKSTESKSNLAVGRSGEEDARIKFALNGCHDTTLGAILCSFGVFDQKWPPYTSHLAIELFREADKPPSSGATTTQALNTESSQKASPLRSLISTIRRNDSPSPSFPRKPLNELTPAEKKKLDGLYVRIQYNDHPVVIPGCKPTGKHLEGNESFCTLEAFKSIADKFTPRNWKEACVSNLTESPFPKQNEPAGH